VASKETRAAAILAGRPRGGWLRGRFREAGDHLVDRLLRRRFADQHALEGGEYGALGPAGGAGEARLRDAEAEGLGRGGVHRVATDAFVLGRGGRGWEVAGLFEEGDGGVGLAPELDPFPGRVGVLRLGDRIVGIGEAGDALGRTGRNRHGAELDAGVQLGSAWTRCPDTSRYGGRSSPSGRSGSLR